MRTIKLNQNKILIIDDEDFELVNTRHWHWQGAYVVSNQVYVNGKRFSPIRIHRFLLNPPLDKDIDHINGNRLDNRRENLRICTTTQNMQNMRKRKNLSSIYKGVSLLKNRNYGWRAEITYKGKQRVIGYFDTEHKAAIAYDFWADYLFGEFARLNFVKAI